MWRLFYDDDDGSFHAFNLANLQELGFVPRSPEQDPDYQDEIEWVEGLGYVLASSLNVDYQAGCFKDEESHQKWLEGQSRGETRHIAVTLHNDPGNDFDDTVWEYDGTRGFYVLSRFEEHSDQSATSLLSASFNRVETAVIERIGQLEDRIVKHMDCRFREAIDPSQELPKKDRYTTAEVAAIVDRSDF